MSTTATPLPDELLGRDSGSIWLNQLRQCIEERTPLLAPDYAIDTTADGFTYRFDFDDLGADRPRTAYSVGAVFGPYLRCHPFDSEGAPILDETISILKPCALVLSDPAETSPTGDEANAGETEIDSDGDDEEQSRIVIYRVDDNEVEQIMRVRELIFPNYREGSVIIAESVPAIWDSFTDEGRQVELMDMNVDARHWRMERKLFKVCVGNEIKNQMMPGGTIQAVLT